MACTDVRYSWPLAYMYPWKNEGPNGPDQEQTTRRGARQRQRWRDCMPPCAALQRKTRRPYGLPRPNLNRAAPSCRTLVRCVRMRAAGNGRDSKVECRSKLRARLSLHLGGEGERGFRLVCEMDFAAPICPDKGDGYASTSDFRRGGCALGRFLGGAAAASS